MARKLLIFVALISLVILTQVLPGYAATYTLPGGEPDTWTETFPLQSQSAYTPGSLGSTFSGHYTWGDGGLWQFGGDYSLDPNDGKYKVKVPLTNTVEATVETDSYGWFHTFVYTYDSTVTPGEVRFTVNIPDGGPSIISYDAQFTITATYIPQPGDTWSFENFLAEYTGTIQGGGTNIDGTPFFISAILREDTADHNHSGHFESFQLTYEPSTVPIPGAAWLLGTGLLGLFCLKRRF